MRRLQLVRSSLSRTPKRLFSSQRTAPFDRSETIPFREFVHEQLYGSEGYFTKNAPVRRLTNPIPFEKLRSEADYRASLMENMEKKQGWTTPVEIFRPYYAHALGNYISQAHDASEPLEIFEIGGGNGTCAEGIMDYLRYSHPKLYEKTNYTIIDISPSLHQVQKDYLQTHSNIRLVNSSIFDFTERCEKHCFVIALEVLDNLPHDKVVTMKRQLREIRVAMKPPENRRSEFSQEEYPLEVDFPVEDEFVKDYCQLLATLYPNDPPPLHYPSSFVERLQTMLGGMGKFGKEFYLPTVAVQLLRQLDHQFPRHRLLWADFSSLPASLPGVNGPRVQSEWRKFPSCVAVPMGTADIFFPTNFPILADIYRLLRWQSRGEEAKVDIVNPRQFFFRYATPVFQSSGEVLHANPMLTLTRESSARTFSVDYNPLLNDFLNTRFFLT